MSKAYEYEQLHTMLDSPDLKSGLYLLDTELSDEEIEAYVKSLGFCSYVKGSLITTKSGSSFEMFVIGLSCQCIDNSNIVNRCNVLFNSGSTDRGGILYSLLIMTMQHLCKTNENFVHICGEYDLTSLNHEELSMLKGALDHNNSIVLITSNYKGYLKSIRDPLITKKVLGKHSKIMENKLNKVYISYKHEDKYDYALKSIINGLHNNNIPYSIDTIDIKYKDDIVKYEKKIGGADRVIMFVIPSYLESIDCMFEMSEIFKNKDVVERVYPVVNLESIPRNIDGLESIRNYWRSQKDKIAELTKTESSSFDYIISDFNKINAILKQLDDFWDFIVHRYTGDYNKLVENDAALLMEELQKVTAGGTQVPEEKFEPSESTKPTVIRTISQNGEKAIYIENNNGNITIN